MKITIEGALGAPTWMIMERVIKAALRAPKGCIYSIRRLDGGCDYQALGEYSLLFDTQEGGDVSVHLEVKP